MTNRERNRRIQALVWELSSEEALKRLEGVQGPERHLVGDVAERIPRQDVVEVTKSGRRGVGKTVGADELHRYIESSISEARVEQFAAASGPHPQDQAYYEGQVHALVELRNYVVCRTDERSGLPNVPSVP